MGYTTYHQNFVGLSFNAHLPNGLPRVRAIQQILVQEECTPKNIAYYHFPCFFALAKALFFRSLTVRARGFLQQKHGLPASDTQLLFLT